MKLEKSGVKLKDGAAGIFEKYCDGVGLLPAACEFKMFRAGKTYCNHVKCVWRERERGCTCSHAYECALRKTKKQKNNFCSLWALYFTFIFFPVLWNSVHTQRLAVLTGSLEQTKQTDITSCSKAKCQEYGLKIFSCSQLHFLIFRNQFLVFIEEN